MPKKPKEASLGRTPEGNWLSEVGDKVGDKFKGLRRSVDRFVYRRGIPCIIKRNYYDPKLGAVREYDSNGQILVGPGGRIVNSDGEVVIKWCSLSGRRYITGSYSLEEFCKFMEKEIVRIENPNYLDIVKEQINLAIYNHSKQGKESKTHES